MSPKYPASIRLTADEKAALSALANLRGINETDCMRFLFAQGWRRVMEKADGGIKGFYLDVLTAEAIPELFVQWVDARATAAGTPGPLANTFHLVQSQYGPIPERLPKGPQSIGAAVSDLSADDAGKRLAAVNFLSLSLVDADPAAPTGFLPLLIAAASGSVRAREGVQDLIASGAVRPAVEG